jgi:hypothetical protein
MYRIHIDIPLSCLEEDAIAITNAIIANISNSPVSTDPSISTLNYRLGHDEDRQKSNYMIKTDSGHVSNKKCKVVLNTDLMDNLSSED